MKHRPPAKMTGQWEVSYSLIPLFIQQGTLHFAWCTTMFQVHRLSSGLPLRLDNNEDGELMTSGEQRQQQIDQIIWVRSICCYISFNLKGHLYLEWLPTRFTWHYGHNDNGESGSEICEQ